MCIITLEHSPACLRWLLFYAIGELVQKGKYEKREELCVPRLPWAGERPCISFLHLVVQGAAPSLANGHRFSSTGGADYPRQAEEHQIQQAKCYELARPEL